MMIKRFSLFSILCVLVLINLLSAQQSRYSPKVEKGLELFYQAEFDRAVDVLGEVLDNPLATQADLFMARVYTAFTLIRSGVESAVVDQMLQTAIRANPGQSLDPMRTPPDLFKRFNSIRRSMMGDIVIKTEPADANVVLIDPEVGSKVSLTHPAVFSDLVNDQYQIAVTRKGYAEKVLQVEVTGGKPDTLFVSLQKQTVNWMRYAPWAGGAVLLGTLLATQLGGGDDDSDTPPSAVLPSPPNRP
jgi:hypothetical protein